MTQISITAGELAILFARLPSDTPEWKMEREIEIILVRNKIKQPTTYQHWSDK